MHFFSHAQGGTQHDEPNKEKPAHFLGPHVPGNQIGVSGKNLQAHRHQQQQHHEDVEIEKSNIIMVGQTGTGKTLVAKTIAKIEMVNADLFCCLLPWPDCSINSAVSCASMMFLKWI